MSQYGGSLNPFGMGSTQMSLLRKKALTLWLARYGGQAPPPGSGFRPPKPQVLKFRPHK